MTRDSEPTNRVAVAHRTALTLVVALAMSIVIYAGVGVLILNLRSAGSQAQPLYSFYAAAAVLAIASILLRRTQLHGMKLEVVAGTRGAEGLIKHLLNTTILAAAIAEVIGVLALMVAFFGGDRNDVIRLAIVALAVSLYNYPRRSAWQRAVDYFSASNAGTSEGSLGL